MVYMDNITKKHDEFVRIKNMDLFYSDMIIDRVIQRKNNKEMK